MPTRPAPRKCRSISLPAASRCWSTCSSGSSTKCAPGDLSKVAEDVGRAYGSELAGEIGVPDEPGYDGAVQAVATR